MNLTIAELAQAVDKSETYVRQHIHREHLTVQRNGRNVSVALDEAVRWARERGLSFVSPTRASVTTEDMKDRTARMTVLAWQKPGAQPRNLFTFIRHRRQDALGPWAGEPNETWSNEDLGHELRLFTFDTSFERCQVLVDHILNSGKLEIDGLEVHYSLEPNPRLHWAYRDDRPLSDASMRSPFTKYSAEIIEYWSFKTKPHKSWLEVIESLQGNALPQLAHLGFPLDRRPDRIGNLMIAGAEDAITSNLVARHDRTLRFQVDGDELLPGAYRATVWASHSGDEVLRREVSVMLGETVIELASDVDHIGFEIYRTSDGQCVDLMEVLLVMAVAVSMEIESGPTLHLRERKSHLTHSVNPSTVSTINIQSDRDSAELDKGIRRLWLDRRVHQREADARREGNFARFGPDELNKAIQYFIDLLRQDADRTEPIYLADPYFMGRLKGNRGTQLYLDMFAATTGRPLHILCTQKDNNNVPPWWSSYPNHLTAHVSVRAFRKHDGTPGFHDRYLITPRREIIITHSLNGWLKDGVTFACLPYGIYRAEAEQLWSMNVGATTTRLLVREIS
ncbi:MAG: hypothetical protein F4079_04580 [Candidatus Dadabacteria bacterium]|nr:hypothetical protein [Gemmatimonadota bacterium]MYI73560.1 hypothetical protein [Candidatus Dadabacteria bacterium]